jgi:hypothetical protein
MERHGLHRIYVYIYEGSHWGLVGVINYEPNIHGGEERKTNTGLLSRAGTTKKVISMEISDTVLTHEPEDGWGMGVKGHSRRGTFSRRPAG